MFRLEPNYTNGDSSIPKYALYIPTVDENGNEDMVVLIWGYWEDILGWSEGDYDEAYVNLDKTFEMILGFIPEYEIG